MTKMCPKCHAAFECKVDDIKNCFCSSIQGSPKVYQFIKEQYTSCLCEKCLKDLCKE